MIDRPTRTVQAQSFDAQRASRRASHAGPVHSGLMDDGVMQAVRRWQMHADTAQRAEHHVSVWYSMNRIPTCNRMVYKHAEVSACSVAAVSLLLRFTEVQRCSRIPPSTSTAACHMRLCSGRWLQCHVGANSCNFREERDAEAQSLLSPLLLVIATEDVLGVICDHRHDFGDDAPQESKAEALKAMERPHHCRDRSKGHAPVVQAVRSPIVSHGLEVVQYGLSLCRGG
mmetsp:Transcript_48717/g.135165  ORF Transcript_48717/g.135165 Transcript_48717/m.135165 type:complete len:228 (-) Transcript_48717:3789-4472(-)